MPTFPFYITIFSLSPYLLYLYRNQNNYLFLHCLYTTILILFNSSKLQSNQQFYNINNPSIPLASPVNSNQTSKPNLAMQNNCKICNKIKPPRYYHCRRCNLCLFQMDHHCQWLNCCVAQYNYKIYIHILINLLIIGLTCMIFMFLQDQSWVSVNKILRIVFSGFMIWEAGRMGIGCIQNISKNQTLVQTYKRVKGPKKQLYIKLKQIFGNSISINWLLPTFSNSKNCNIWQETQPISQQAKQNLIQYTYADEYLYGADDQDQYNNLINQNQEKQIQKQKEKQVVEAKNE